uniref:Nicotinic acetylcholine receptor alpha subunit n=1 Tax=Globodera pallida TaxID=36090 RepID=A0A183CAT7_GLOPA
MIAATAIAAMAFLCPTIWSNFRATATKISRKSYESQLYEDLLFTYNKIARPVRNSSDVLLIDVGASLIRIIDVDEKNQVLTTNLWLEMRWNDAKLQWDPYKYGGIRQLHIPSTDIWVPDFVLYDNAAGDPDITIFTDALVSFNGRVYWQPPAIYKSFCPIKVKWFPYDKQECKMKFGAWSYTGFYVDLRQLPRDQIELRHSEKDGEYEYMENGMDLSFFHRSAEWDLMNLTAARHDVLYASCCGPEKFVDITYYLELRRKTLFFTCNLIVPCFLISFLTTFVFYLSDHKITFSISILVTLTVFFLVLIDLTPPTSLEVPMFVGISLIPKMHPDQLRFGQYLITTMILVALSTMVSVVTVNIRFRSGATHQMSPWIRVIFLNLLPKMLLMKRPERPPKCKLSEPGAGQMPKSPSSVSANASPNALASICPSLIAKTPIERDGAQNAKGNGAPNLRTSRRSAPMSKGKVPPIVSPSADLPRHCIYTKMYKFSVEMSQAPMFGRSDGERDVRRRANDAIFANLVKQVRFIAEYFQRCEEEAEISDDWTFVAMVLDRLFLVIFSALNMATFSTIISAPSLFDFREPLNVTVPTRPLGQANLFSRHSQ